jgi:gliding motility-associated-like protein
MIEVKKSILSLWLLVALLVSATALAQTCDNPTSLCGGDVVGVSEYAPIDFSGTPISTCLTGDAWSVARFHTTYLNTSNGVTISLQNVDCPNTTLQAIVVLPDQLDYCDTGQYSPVSDCITVASDVTFTTYGLYTNTDYLILFCHQTGIVPTPCEFSLTVSGEPLSIEACCPTSIDFEETAALEVIGGDGNVGYQWEPAEHVDNPSAYQVEVSPDQTTIFTVSGFVESCEYSDQVIVTVGSVIDVPNSFSPNGDNINDTWDITGLDSYPGSIVTLYDRWGQQILRHVGSLDWDGRYSGKDAPIGTYYYVIDLHHPSISLASLTGNVAIIR